MVNLDPNAPPCENEEEIITDVTLTFTPVGGGDPITASAQDPDGEGPLDLEITENIELVENTEYTLSIELLNSIEGEDITEEIMEEDDEHMFFFEWTDGLFTDPTGNGNADNRDDPVNYNDQDENGFPVGLSTSWTTSGILSGTFRVVLKHQPDIKSATSTINDGDSDIDLEWDFNTVTSIIPYKESKQVFQIWPNPSQGTVRWKISNWDKAVEDLVIYDQIGRIVSKIKRPNAQLTLNNLAPGYYSILAHSHGKNWVQRLVITK